MSTEELYALVAGKRDAAISDATAQDLRNSRNMAHYSDGIRDACNQVLAWLDGQHLATERPREVYALPPAGKGVTT